LLAALFNCSASSAVSPPTPLGELSQADTAITSMHATTGRINRAEPEMIITDFIPLTAFRLTGHIPASCRMTRRTRNPAHKKRPHPAGTAFPLSEFLAVGQKLHLRHSVLGSIGSLVHGRTGSILGSVGASGNRVLRSIGTGSSRIANSVARSSNSVTGSVGGTSSGIHRGFASIGDISNGSVSSFRTFFCGLLAASSETERSGENE
jgi:hypothetical protein